MIPQLGDKNAGLMIFGFPSRKAKVCEPKLSELHRYPFQAVYGTL